MKYPFNHDKRNKKRIFTRYGIYLYWNFYVVSYYNNRNNYRFFISSIFKSQKFLIVKERTYV